MSLVLPPSSLGQRSWAHQRTCIFGVVNVTPDSFYDGGQHADPAQAVEHGLRLYEAGADVVDVGGESTRPGAQAVGEQQELDRVLPVVEGIAARCPVPISVDTYKARVAREALAAGAGVVNDVSGMLLDPEMPAVIAASGRAVVLGHLRGRPGTMMEGIAFADVVAEVIDELRDRVRAAVDAGIGPAQIWIDPGIGFGKTAEQSLLLLKGAGRIRQEVGYPLLVGPSRKAFIGAVTGQPVGERLMGTASAVSAAVIAGADAVRVHDVAELLPAVRVADAIRRGGRS